ncbi:MAG: hypothetical protein QW197_01920 [Candidatus Aenigmatarchaeota archaeon]
MVYFSVNILFINIVKKNYIISKQSAEFFANVLSSVSSSSSNLSIILTLPPSEMKIYFFENNVTVYIKNEKYSEVYFKPSYIVLDVKNPITANKQFPSKIIISKVNDKITIS